MGHGTKSCESRKGLGFAGSHLALEVEGEDHEANGKVRGTEDREARQRDDDGLMMHEYG